MPKKARGGVVKKASGGVVKKPIDSESRRELQLYASGMAQRRFREATRAAEAAEAAGAARAAGAAGAAGVGAPSKKSKASSKRIPVIKAPPGSIRTRPPGYEARKESEAEAARLTAQRLGRKKGGIVRENKGHGGKAGSGKNSKTAARNAATLDATSNPSSRDRVSRGGGAALRGIGFEGVF